MTPLAAVEFPPEVEETHRRARRLEWITLAYVATAAASLYLTMGSSRAMKASFYDDAISFVPAASFLIGTAVARRKPSPTYPYGTHRATSIAHLVAAVSLCAMGLFLLVEAGLTVFGGEKPTIGGMSLFDAVIWAGWPMLAALAYSSIPTVILGRMKAKLAPKLHDKVLHADADMMKADWMAAAATAIGVIGVGFGVWWLDPLAAALVSVDILKDGGDNLATAVADLIDRRPKKVDQSDWERLPDEVRGLLMRMDWVEAAEVRMREAGHVLVGDALVVPRPGTEDLVAKLARAAEEAKALDWRVHEMAMLPVERLPD